MLVGDQQGRGKSRGRCNMMQAVLKLYITGLTNPAHLRYWWWKGIKDFTGTGVTESNTGVTEPNTGVTKPGIDVAEIETDVTEPNTGVTKVDTGATEPETGVT